MRRQGIPKYVVDFGGRSYWLASKIGKSEEYFWIQPKTQKM
jgi:hypothetical protein